jgi:hypothetical protein
VDPHRTPILTRASHMKDVLLCAEQRGPALVQRLEAASPQALPAIRAATRVEWLPHEIAFDVTRSLEQAVGLAETRAIYLEACLSSFRSGTLGPLFASALRIFGPSPHLFAKFLPLAWKAVWRGCGDLVVEEARPGLVRLRHMGIPRDALDEAFQEVCATSIGSVIVACEKRGRASVERRSGRDPIGYLLEWEQPADSRS